MVSEKLRRILNHIHYQSFYFTFYGGYLPFLLYFPLYLKHIGLNAAQVGVINGVRPLFQSIATPLLVLISDRLQSRKLLFIISSLVAIVKLIGLFLLLKPSHQHCVVKNVEYINKSRIVTENSYIIQHRLSKRDVVMHDWSLLGKIQDNTIMKEKFDNNVGETLRTQLHYQEKNTLSNRGEQKTINWKENDENAVQNGSELIINVMNKTTPSAENTRRNITIFNHNISKPEYTAVIKKGNRSETEYRIINDDYEVRRLFYSLLIIALISDMFDASIFTLVDHSCIGHQEENYGFIRLWGTLGWGFMSPVMAIVMHNAPHEFCGHIVDTYHYVFIFAIVFFNVSLLIGSHLDLDAADFRDVKVKKIHSTRSNFHYGMFLIVFAYAGFCSGFLSTFVNWFIDSIGGSAGVMGVAIGCKATVDVVLFFFLRKIIDFCGYVVTVSLGLVGHIAVFYIFSRITNPWLVVALEVAHALFYGFLVSTCAFFLDQSVPAGSNLRLQALLHGIYWGVGSGSGALFSGLHVDYNGFSETFVIFTWMTTAVAFIYLTVELLTFVIDIKIFGDHNKSFQQSSTSSTGSDADVSSEGASSDVETDD